MADSVFGIAMSGLNAARAGLSTSSHNISNVNTEGYSRQAVVQDVQSAQAFGSGFLGQGVAVKEIVRNHNDYLTAQLSQAASQSGYYDAFKSQINRVDNLLGDSNSGIADSLSSFFSSVQSLSAQPNNGASRQNFISSAQALTDRFRSLDQSLTDLRAGVNDQISTGVQTINSYTSQIAELNNKIVVALNQGINGASPNDLLDKRDTLIRQLSEQVQTTVVKQGDGSLNVFLANGQAVVVNDKSFKLSAVRDAGDPENLQLGLTVGQGAGNQTLIKFGTNDLGTGKLGGAVAFRDGPLAEYQNTLGLIAAQFASKVNSIHSGGFDANGVAGQPVFSISPGRVISNENNTGNASVALDPNIDYAQLNGSDYELYQEPGATGQLVWRINGSRDNPTPASLVSAGPPATYNIDGRFNFTLTGTPSAGDKFTLLPTRDAAKNISVLISDPSKVAASGNATNLGDNQTLLSIAGLQSAKVLYQHDAGSTGISVSDAFNQLVSRVGNKTLEVGAAQQARSASYEQALSTQQEVSGVNLDEEAANLMKYQQAYQASSRVISLSKEMFDLIISMTK